MAALRVLSGLLLVILLVACGKQQTSSPSTNPSQSGDATKTSPVQAPTDPRLAKGRAVYEEVGCGTCHAIGGIGGQTGPSLDGIGKKYDESKLREILLNPRILNPTTVMPPFEGSEEDLDALVAYLKSLQ